MWRRRRRFGCPRARCSKRNIRTMFIITYLHCIFLKPRAQCRWTRLACLSRSIGRTIPSTRGPLDSRTGTVPAGEKTKCTKKKPVRATETIILFFSFSIWIRREPTFKHYNAFPSCSNDLVYSIGMSNNI